MESKAMTCGQCGRQYTSRPAYLRHQKTHDQSRWHTCAVCRIKFSRLDVLQRHQKVHEEASKGNHRDQRKRAALACDACKKSKIRCDAARPCSSCRMVGKSCSYLMKVNRPSIIALKEHDRTAASSDAFDGASMFEQNVKSSTLPVVESLQNEDLGAANSIDSVILAESELMGSVNLNIGLTEQEAFDYAPPQLYDMAVGTIDADTSELADTTPQNTSRGSNFVAHRVSGFADHMANYSTSIDRISNSLSGTPCGNWVTYRIAQEAFNEFFRMPRRGTLFRWRKRITLAGIVQQSFQIFDLTYGHSTHLLHTLVTSFFDNFHTSWPIIWRQGFQYDDVEPLLYLTMTSIGAIYANSSHAQAYGLEMLYALQPLLLNACLTCPRDETKLDAIFEALLLVEIMSLYIGSDQALEYSQRASEVLVAHARHIISVEEFIASSSGETLVNGGNLEEKEDEEVEHDLNEFIKRERRRRLVFGFYRCEVFSSIIRNTEPLMSFEELKLQPPCKHESWTYTGLAWREKLLCASQEAAGGKLVCSDFIRVAPSASETADSSLPRPSAAIQNLILHGL